MLLAVDSAPDLLDARRRAARAHPGRSCDHRGMSRGDEEPTGQVAAHDVVANTTEDAHPAVPALLRARTEVIERLRALRGGFDEIVAASADSNADDEHDPEGATIAFERAQVDALARQAQSRLEEIDAALSRVAAGTYGRCEVCARPIPAERLAVRPTAQRCVGCVARRV